MYGHYNEITPDSVAKEVDKMFDKFRKSAQKIRKELTDMEVQMIQLQSQVHELRYLAKDNNDEDE